MQTTLATRYELPMLPMGRGAPPVTLERINPLRDPLP
jgi:hypothetical protein